jgi:hypothetical protein
MKPFNLERALAGDPVVTRDGRPVKIAGYNEEAEEDEFCLLGWANNMNHGWHSDGTYMRGVENGKDLFMAPNERKEWIVRCGVGDVVKYEGPFPTEEAAKVYADNYEWRTVHEILIVE